MIFLTEHENLREGLYWAREITGEQDLGRSKWLIVCVTGQKPFLDVYVVAYQPEQHNASDDEPWSGMGYICGNRHVRSFRANQWEFGLRIEIPSDKERVEYAPQMATEKVMAR